MTEEVTNIMHVIANYGKSYNIDEKSCKNDDNNGNDKKTVEHDNRV